jgi:hypothetical protein
MIQLMFFSFFNERHINFYGSSKLFLYLTIAINGDLIFGC